MKLEAMMLNSLCALGMLVCALVLGAMLTSTPPLVGDKAAVNTARTTLAACPPIAAAVVSPPERS